MEVKFIPETHEYELNGKKLPAVTEILKDLGIINAKYYTEEGSGRGKFIHSLCAEADGIEIPLLMGNYKGPLNVYVDAWLRFKEDFKFEIIDIEKPIVHTGLRYAGTPDRIGKIDGEITIVDIKTGAKQSWHGLQLVAYKIALDKMTLGIKAKTLVVYLKENGKYNLGRFNEKYLTGIWLNILSVYGFKYG